jgi:hypothetical protein
MFFALSGKIFSHLQKAFVFSFLFFLALCVFLRRIGGRMVIIVTYETASRGTH